MRRGVGKVWGAILAVGLFHASAWAAAPPQPTYGAAVKDGNPDTGGPGNEWQYRPSAGFPLGYDFWGNMHVGGDVTKEKLGAAYLRYDCDSGLLYVLVLQKGFPATGTSPVIPQVIEPTGNAWAKIGTGLVGSGPKLYNDTNPGEVLWIDVGYDGNPIHARGYEASAPLAPGNYANFVVHSEAIDSQGNLATSATTGFKTTSDPLVIQCPTTDNPKVKIIKKTNGEDANFPPGPSIPQGAQVTWSYEVTNEGNVPLLKVTVTDDKLNSSAIDCGSGSNVVPTLAVGASVTCYAYGISEDGGEVYVNIGTVQGMSESGKVVQDSDPSHYLDAPNGTPHIDIDKTTNGSDGIFLWGGDAIVWTYVVTNDGEVPLSKVTVTDNQLPSSAIDCGGGSNVILSLAVGAKVICKATGVAQAGEYSNIGTVVGAPSFGDSVMDSDASSYFGWASGQITPTDTSCEMFRDHTAATLSEEYYLVSKGAIRSVAPGVFFYYSRIVIPDAGLASVEVRQANDGGWRSLETMQMFLWDEACVKVHQTPILDNGTVRYDTSALAPGVYFISVKYKPNSVVGTELTSPYPDVNYSFGTWRSGTLLPTTDADVLFKAKK